MSLLNIILAIALFFGLPVTMNDYSLEAFEKRNIRTVEVKELSADEEWELFTEAIIWKESRGDEKAVGDNGHAVGVLQIWPIMVKEANRICKLKKINKEYTENDRYSREKSIEMFNVVQGYHNKERDFQKALDIWNENHPASYKTKIMNKSDELKEIALS